MCFRSNFDHEVAVAIALAVGKLKVPVGGAEGVLGRKAAECTDVQENGSFENFYAKERSNCTIIGTRVNFFVGEKIGGNNLLFPASDIRIFSDKRPLPAR